MIIFCAADEIVGPIVAGPRIMASISNQLEQLVKRFSLVTDVAGAIRPGQVARFELRLPSIDPGVSNWLPTQTGTSEIDQELTGTMLGNIEDGAVNGTIAGALNGTLTGDLVGAFTGTIEGRATGTVATIANFRERIAVRVSVKWSFKYADQQEPNSLIPGQDFLGSDSALNGLAVEVLFKPPIMELRWRKRLPRRVSVTATVTVSAPSLDLNEGPVLATAVLNPSARAHLTLPELLLLPIELPTFLALFRFDDHQPYGQEQPDLAAERLDGFVLIIYPENCPLPASLETLNGLLQRIDEVLAPLRSLVGMLTFLDELSILRKAVAAQPMARIVGAPVRKFNDIHLNVEAFFGVDVLNQDRRPDNRVSSLIFVGQPGRQVKCYRRHLFETSDGAFTITLPNTMFLRIRSLRLGNAAMNDIEGVTVTNNSEDDFNDNMSSVRYLQDIPA